MKILKYNIISYHVITFIYMKTDNPKLLLQTRANKIIQQNYKHQHLKTKLIHFIFVEYKIIVEMN